MLLALIYFALVATIVMIFLRGRRRLGRKRAGPARTAPRGVPQRPRHWTPTRRTTGPGRGTRLQVVQQVQPTPLPGGRERSLRA